MGLPKFWGTSDGLKGFVFSHVKTIYYNYAQKKLLSTKLDEMDANINSKIAKSSMSNQQVNDTSKVPTSALVYNMQNSINTLNANAVMSENVGSKTMTELMSVSTSYSKPVLGYIPWNSAIAPDKNNAIVFCWKDSALAISISGKLYWATNSAPTWQKQTA